MSNQDGHKNIIDIDVIGEDQILQELHIPDEEDGIDFITSFYRAPTKTNWAAYKPEKLLCTQEDSDVLSFQVSTAYHFLTMSSLGQKFPALKVSDKIIDPEEGGTERFSDNIQICWNQNLLTNTIKWIVFECNGVPCGYLDNVIMDIHPQLFAESKKGWRKNYDVQVGNTDKQICWTNQLEPFEGYVELPWYYGKESSFAFPLFYDRQAVIKHRIKIRRKISKLLRIRWRQNSKAPWQYDPPVVGVSQDGKPYKSWAPLLKEIEGIEINNGLLPQPEMIAEYGQVSDAELNHYLGIKIDKDGSQHIDENVRERVYWAEDFVHWTDDNPRLEGQTVLVNPKTKTPSKAIIMLSENYTATKRNNRSNYTTNINNIDLGFSPIESFSMYYGSTEKFKDLSSDYCTKIIAQKKFKSCPIKPGYVPYSLSNDIGIIGDQIGVTFNKKTAVELRIKLGDMNPAKKIVNKTEFLGGIFKTSEKSDVSNKIPILKGHAESNNSSDKENENIYTIHVVLLVIRKIVFSRVEGKDESGRPRFIIDKEKTR